MILAAVSLIIGGFGTILNFLVCFVYFKKPQLLDAPNIFILNIAIGNMALSAMLCPFLFLSNVRGEWIFGQNGCTLYGFLAAFFSLSSMVHLAGAAYERYLTFCALAIGSVNSFNRKKAITVSLALWGYSLLWSLLPVLGWSSYAPQGTGTSCAVNWTSREATDMAYVMCLLLACFVLPVSVIVYCYYKSYKAIHQMTTYVMQNWSENDQVTREALQAERRLAKVAFAITLGFLFAWTPYAISSMLGVVDPNLTTGTAASIPAYIAKSSACYNPFIYAFMYKKLRIALFELCCCRMQMIQVHPTVEPAAHPNG